MMPELAVAAMFAAIRYDANGVKATRNALQRSGRIGAWSMERRRGTSHAQTLGGEREALARGGPVLHCCDLAPTDTPPGYVTVHHHKALVHTVFDLQGA